MALHRQDLSAEELDRQHALDLAWSEAGRRLADPAFRSFLAASLRRLDEEPSGPLLSGDEFLAQTT